MRYTTVLAWVMVSAAGLTGEPAAAQVSHLGQDIIDHVVLRDGTLSGRVEAVCPGTASFKGRGLFRLLPDGSRESGPFVVPAGRQLVITDVEWTVNALALGGSLTPGASVRTRLQIGSGTTFDTVFLSRTVVVGPERGIVSASEQLTTGFVVASNTAICPGSTESEFNFSKSANLLEIILRGYLISGR